MTDAHADRPAWDALASVVTASNPFVDNRVTGLARPEADASEVHAAPFARLMELAQEALREHRGLGVMLWGEAGVGKSHLLARLGRWAARDGHATLVTLHNLQAAPEGLPRSLLRAVVSVLTLGRAHRFRGTPLFLLVASFCHEAFGYDPGVRPTWPQLRQGYNALVDALSQGDPSQAALVDHAAYGVLFHFFRAAFAEGRSDSADDARDAALAVRWLAGDYLDPAEARRIGLPPGPNPSEPVALRDAQQIKQVLVALSRLALGRRQPFILCFDQVDNLDADQAAALARFLEALLDGAPNLLVVTAGIQSSILHWRQARLIQDSAWDRIGQFTVQLTRVPPEDAFRIVSRRLDAALAPAGDEAVALARRQDPLFPLGQAWWTNFLGQKVDVRPRDVLNSAREAWSREQDKVRQQGAEAWFQTWGQAEATPPPPAPPALTPEQEQAAVDRRVRQRLDELRAERLEEPYALPPDADRLAELTARLLQRCRQAGVAPGVTDVTRHAAGSPGPRTPCDVTVRLRPSDESGETALGLVFVATGNATSTAGSLRRLIQSDPRPDVVLLVTDERRPLALGEKGKDYLQRLREEMPGRFHHRELTVTEYVNLDALAVVSGPGSTDLEVPLGGGQSRPLRPDEALAALARLGALQSAPLVSDVLEAARNPIPRSAQMGDS